MSTDLRPQPQSVFVRMLPLIMGIMAYILARLALGFALPKIFGFEPTPEGAPVWAFAVRTLGALAVAIAVMFISARMLGLRIRR
jgi:hypothetical protein